MQTLPLEIKSGTDIPKNNLSVSAKINMQLPHDSAIILLGIYPREIKIWAQMKTCIQVFVAHYP